MSKKRSSVFEKKINRGDTAELVTKRRSPGFSGKNRVVTLSVAAPGVTHPSDATEHYPPYLKYVASLLQETEMFKFVAFCYVSLKHTPLFNRL